jgi:hypothetical protein
LLDQLLLKLRQIEFVLLQQHRHQRLLQALQQQLQQQVQYHILL